MKKFFLVFIPILLLLMFILNPDSKAHKEKILTDIKPVVIQTVMADENRFTAIFASAFLGNYIDEALLEQIRVDDYYLFSLTKAKDHNDIIGIGVLGKVFLFITEEDVIRNLQKNADKE